MNRGDRREAVFKDDSDRQRFVETLGEAGGKTGWQVYAYVLMRIICIWCPPSPDAERPWTREPCDDVDPMPDYENVLTD